MFVYVKLQATLAAIPLATDLLPTAIPPSNVTLTVDEG
jgi:hypothetical protein